MKQPTPPKCVNGIWFTEDDLAGAIFCNSTVTTTGQCTRQEARQAARMMLGAQELLDAANMGGGVETLFKTFDVELPADVKAYLREFTDERDRLLAEKKNIWWNREVIGVEVLRKIEGGTQE